jgi:mRNA interferase MazF
MSTTAGGVRPARGEVWTIDLNPTVGREQAGTRPALIVSVNPFNWSARGLVMIAPITGTSRGILTHVPTLPPEGGLTKPSVIMVEQLRSVSKDRLGRCLGSATSATMDEVGRHLRMLLGL